MPISFRCEHCGKKIEAPDSAGGKRGKCPYCRQGNYIPAPTADDDVFDLAPVDEEDETRSQAEMQRLRQIEAELLAERSAESPVPLEHRDDLSSKDLHHYAINYCLDMADGRLERAEKHIDDLARFAEHATQAVDEVASSIDDEPALKDIPQPVVKGLLEQLLQSLKERSA